MIAILVGVKWCDLVLSFLRARLPVAVAALWRAHTADWWVCQIIQLEKSTQKPVNRYSEGKTTDCKEIAPMTEGSQLIGAGLFQR